MIKYLIIFVLFFSSIVPTFGHEFDTETMEYILSTPEASWSDFSSYIKNSDDAILQQEILNTESKLSIILSLPGKEYVVNYALENPDFTYSEIENEIRNDPMLQEIGSETIYSFLASNLKENPASFSPDFFLRTIVIGLQHIISGYDHILFLLTLIVCLPRLRRILGIITTFTIAHCITLVLGGLGIISVPSIIVESMILISIIIMAIYAIKNRVGQVKNIYLEISIIFILGLFHGLGFAGFFTGVLETSQNIIFPVLGFNIGVELGQISIMVVILTILSLIYEYLPRYKEHIKNTLSVLCIFIASYWLLTSFI